MPDNRESCWSQSQKDHDSFMKAWMDDIPATTLSKAVWEYNRDEVTFKPYRWDGYQISPNIPSFLIDNVIMQVAGLRTPHPRTNHNKFACKYVLWFHLPSVCILTLLYVFLLLKPQSSTNQVVIHVFFNSMILLLTMILVIMIIKRQKDYSKALKERETQLARLMDHITVTTLAPYRIKAVGGKCGAWVELQFEDPSTFMVMGGPGFGGAAQQYPHLGSAPSLAPNANPFGYHQAPQFA